MADKLRQVAQRLKESAQVTQIITNVSKDKIGSIVAKYSPAVKVSEIAEKFKKENLSGKVRELVSKYEKFTGVEEILAIQKSVVAAQDRFMQAQDRRRELGRQVAELSNHLKEIHAEMQNTMKGDEKYLHLVTEEHKLILHERSLRDKFSEAEREEREQFAAMSSAVKLGHEREKAHAERNKYWYIVASIMGTLLGIAGSSVNNHLKMAEFRDMLQQQMARSTGALYTAASGHADLNEALRAEFTYQEQLAKSVRTIQDMVNHLVLKNEGLQESIASHEGKLNTQIGELKKIVIATSAKSAKSDAELAKVLSVVQHDIEDQGVTDLYKADPTSDKVSLEPKQIVAGLGVVACMAFVLGNILSKIS